MRILQKTENIPNRWSNDDTHKTKTPNYNGMGGWHLKDVFEKEGVELRHLPENNKLTHCKEAHVGAIRIHPTHVRPILRSELQNSSLDFSRS